MTLANYSRPKSSTKNGVWMMKFQVIIEKNNSLYNSFRELNMKSFTCGWDMINTYSSVTIH